jgi:hydroxymethylbilane synthase
MSASTVTPAPDARAVVRLGTRRSALATAQARLVADALTAASGVVVELVPITTYGDESQQAQLPLETIGGTGVFATELRRALVTGDIDIAVHSLKDLPTGPADGLVIAAIPRREDPRDVLVARDGLTLGELPAGARVGTGSPRRAAQLLALDLGLRVEPIRGNVDSRLRAVAEGRYDAVVLARAGLLRLGRADEASEIIDPIQMLPAPGQGALAVEVRSDDSSLIAQLAALDDPDSNVAVRAERSLLAALEAGCSSPIGALAEVVEGDDGPELSLRAVVAAPDGSDALRRSLVGPVEDAESLGARLAAVLIEDGAQELVPQSHLSVASSTDPRIGGNVLPNPSSTSTERVS